MKLTIGVFGDIHGQQHLMYQVAREWEHTSQRSLNLLLQVGDFETIRDESDFKHYYAPEKYKRISDFSKYYDGTAIAPHFTIFNGGNHEARGFLEQYQQGGYIAPEIYYLGRSSVIEINGLRIAGITGIYNQRYYASKPTIPYFAKYYTHEDVERLQDESVDILLLHDWITPVSSLNVVYEEIIPRNLMSTRTTPTFQLGQQLQPRFVFMGHHAFKVFEITV